MKKIAIMAAMAALAVAFGANAADMPAEKGSRNLKAVLDRNPEIREAICTVGVETLEDNAINLETLKKVPKAKMVMGLKAIKDHLIQNKLMPSGPAGQPAETGTPATPGFPATTGVQVQ